MRWLLEAGTFDCRRFDCPREVGKDCGKCGMPQVGRDVLAVMRLYQRCRDRRALPVAGGLLAQPEAVMAAFDCIDGQVAAWRAEQAEQGEAERMKREMAAKLNG